MEGSLNTTSDVTSSGVVRLASQLLDTDSGRVENISISVWSEFDAGGIELIVTETEASSGVFKGTVLFTTTDEPSGQRLRVHEGDTVTAKHLDAMAQTFVGTIAPDISLRWLLPTYSPSETGVVRLTGLSLNVDSGRVGNLAAQVWSDSDAGGIQGELLRLVGH